MAQTLDAATLRRLAVRASCDPKTIKRVFDSEPVRGLAFHRAHQTLAEAGLLPDTPPARKRSDGGGSHK